MCDCLSQTQTATGHRGRESIRSLLGRTVPQTEVKFQGANLAGVKLLGCPDRNVRSAESPSGGHQDLNTHRSEAGG